MIETYWGLTGSPFHPAGGIPWFHESPVHEEALARLYFVLEERRPLALLRGAEGTGKTLLLSVLADELRRTQRQVIAIDLLGLGPDELAWKLAAGLQLGPDDDAPPLRLWRMMGDSIRGLQASRQPAVVLLDHLDRGHSGCATAIERLLALDRGPTRCLTVIAATRGTDGATAHAALARHADLRIELPALDRAQTSEYVAAALRQAGAGRTLFEPAALETLYRETGGIPRDINRLCELALIAARGDERREVDAAVIESAAAELQAC